MDYYLITGCSTKDKNSSKEVKVLSVKETKLNAGIYNVLEGSSQVLWECEWLGGARHDGSVQLVSGSIDISSSSDVNGKFIVDLNSMKCFDSKNEGTNKKLIGHLRAMIFLM